MSFILMVTTLLVGLFYTLPFLFGMSETFKGTHGYVKVIEAGQSNMLRNNVAKEEKVVNGTNIYCGKLYTDDGETWPDADLHELGESVRGMVLYPKRQPANPSVGVEWDIDDPLDDDSKFTGLVKAQWKGVLTRGNVKAQAGPLTIEEGQYFVAGGGGDFKIEENGKHGRETVINYYLDGNILVANGVAKFIAPADGKIIGARMTAATDGDDGALEADININGTTIFTVQTNQPIIISTDGNDYVDTTTLADCNAGGVNDFVKGDIITVDFDDDGGTTPATDVKLEVDVDYGERLAVAAAEFTGSATLSKIATMELI